MDWCCRSGRRWYSRAASRRARRSSSPLCGRRSRPCVLPPSSFALPAADAWRRQFKCPERVFILETIPKTATGKIQRKALAVRRSLFLRAVEGADASLGQTKFDKEVKESNVPRAKL